jgi:hypothetical protein
VLTFDPVTPAVTNLGARRWWGDLSDEIGELLAGRVGANQTNKGAISRNQKICRQLCHVIKPFKTRQAPALSINSTRAPGIRFAKSSAYGGATIRPAAPQTIESNRSERHNKELLARFTPRK